MWNESWQGKERPVLIEDKVEVRAWAEVRGQIGGDDFGCEWEEGKVSEKRDKEAKDMQGGPSKSSWPREGGGARTEGANEGTLKTNLTDERADNNSTVERGERTTRREGELLVSQ